MGAGTETLLKHLSFDSKTLITNLTMEQFNEIAEKYDNWPFKPKVLLYPFDPFYKIRLLRYLSLVIKDHFIMHDAIIANDHQQVVAIEQVFPALIPQPLRK